MKIRALILGIALTAGAAPLGGGEKLAIRVSPSVAFAPANLVVQTMVSSSKDNRSIEIIAESDEFYRSSEVPLDGDRAPRTTVFRFRSLPTGAYQVRAVLRGEGGKELAWTQGSMSVFAGAANYK
jgi:hypothetical protein